MNEVGKKKILRTAEEKEKAVKRYLAGESATKIANEIDTSDDVIRKWVQKYNSEGIDGLKSKTGKHSNTSKNSGLYLRKPKNKIEELELEKEPYIDVIIYSEDKNDYTVYRESVSENILYTIFCILLTLICEIVPLEIRSTYAFDYDERVEKIKNRYRALDPEELEKKLELKRNDYNSMIK